MKKNGEGRRSGNRRKETGKCEKKLLNWEREGELT